MRTRRGSIATSISVGTGMRKIGDPLSSARLLEIADRALYDSKRSGRDMASFAMRWNRQVNANSRRSIRSPYNSRLAPNDGLQLTWVHSRIDAAFPCDTFATIRTRSTVIFRDSPLSSVTRCDRSEKRYSRKLLKTKKLMIPFGRQAVCSNPAVPTKFSFRISK